MKRQKTRRRVWAVLLALLLTALTPAWAFAGETQSARVEARMAYTAIPETIDVTVSERITLTGTSESTQLDVSDIVISNRSKTLSIQVDSVEVQSVESPWTLVAETTDFAAMELDQHRFSLTADGQDLSQGKLKPQAGEVSAGNSQTIIMEGAAGPLSQTASDVKIATLVVTVSQYEEAVDYGSLAAEGFIEKVVPEGGIYTTADGRVIEAGGEMPETPSNLDSLTYGDYIYRYNACLRGYDVVEVPEINGWNARVVDDSKLSYEPIVHTIQGIYVTSLDYCYVQCEVATTMPPVPYHVTRMINTFEQCWELAGEVEINCNPVVYDNCFIATGMDIVIVGQCSDELKEALADTCSLFNVTWR